MLGQQCRRVAPCHFTIGEKERRKNSRNNKENLSFFFANSIRTRYKSKLMTFSVCGKCIYFFVLATLMAMNSLSLSFSLALINFQPNLNSFLHYI